ncbi:ferritin-like domain-containing protein [Novosphingobium sp. G106]|uniref:ferritin-like domain-containing protein n=1 Tax=Novosphingobium sp. G106 TaxID=2849500 RepID=UPI001C2CF6BC|nr:ferritin-like domain-containing protein [Novosphingobium sp. G106]MBV1688658.1 ferritin-like domain-containing protein [Novosphingobium sp. G106]
MSITAPWGEYDATEPLPRGYVQLGSEAHLTLMCRTLLDTHDPYRPALLDWPKLDPDTEGKIKSLPIWDVAVAVEERAGLNVRTYAKLIGHPLLRSAVEMDAFEESRHKIVLANLVEAYGIAIPPAEDLKPPRDAEWAFMVTGYSECIDSFFGFGLFKLAADPGFFPQELVDTFDPVMREEGRHILFFVNWVAWWRRNMPWWRRPYFELKVLAVWLFLIAERMSFAKGMGANPKGEDTNFTLNGSKELGVEVTFTELAKICLAENDRRLGVYDDRLVRPRFVPKMIRLALRLVGWRNRP